MIKIDDEYLIVRTKYDPFVLRVHEPYLEEISPYVCELSFGHNEYELYDTETMLEGVAINHYKLLYRLLGGER